MEEQEKQTQETREKGKKEEKKKYVYIDDGRTIADMNVEGMPGYDPARNQKKADRLTFKEKMAVLFGAYRAYFPYLVTVLLALAIVYLIFYIIWS